VHTPLWCWFATCVLIVVLLSADFLLHRGDSEIKTRKALVATAAWIAVSILFGIGLGVAGDWDRGGDYFGAYLTEKSLSIDNVFVFAVLFHAFAVPAAYQRRVLFYGVFGALVLRGALIAAGASLISEFEWILYLLGAVLIFSGFRMARGKDVIDLDKNVAIRVLRRIVPVAPNYMGSRFVVRIDGVLKASPLLVVLLAIETTDLFFAMDSIPATFGITTDVFLVFAANAFALLGLRSLYFVLVGAMDHFTYLKYGLAALLAFIGSKMLLAPVLTIPTAASLPTIAVIIGIAIAASAWRERQIPLASMAEASSGGPTDVRARERCGS
jgi:tellurite resistance protein TerC